MLSWLIGLAAAAAAVSASTPSPTAHPSIQSLLKPAVYDHVLNQREVMTHAKIDGQLYDYYAVMLVRASLSETRSILTNYALYSKLISYVNQANYNPASHILEIRGSFMGWGMHSWIRFEEKSDGWIRYSFIAGHFAGMSGDLYFEPYRDSGTLVYLGGFLKQAKWPPIPKMILEWGAEIVFGFTGTHMRSYIESNKTSGKTTDHVNDEKLPQPRSRL